MAKDMYVEATHIYKPTKKDEVRLVYRVKKWESSQRHQKTFSTIKYGEAEAYRLANKARVFINAFHCLPPEFVARNLCKSERSLADLSVENEPGLLLDTPENFFNSSEGHCASSESKCGDLCCKMGCICSNASAVSLIRKPPQKCQKSTPVSCLDGLRAPSVSTAASCKDTYACNGKEPPYLDASKKQMHQVVVDRKVVLCQSEDTSQRHTLQVTIDSDASNKYQMEAEALQPPNVSFCSVVNCDGKPEGGALTCSPILSGFVVDTQEDALASNTTGVNPSSTCRGTPYSQSTCPREERQKHWSLPHSFRQLYPLQKPKENFSKCSSAGSSVKSRHTGSSKSLGGACVRPIYISKSKHGPEAVHNFIANATSFRAQHKGQSSNVGSSDMNDPKNYSGVSFGDGYYDSDFCKDTSVSQSKRAVKSSNCTRKSQKNVLIKCETGMKETDPIYNEFVCQLRPFDDSYSTEADATPLPPIAQYSDAVLGCSSCSVGVSAVNMDKPEQGMSKQQQAALSSTLVQEEVGSGRFSSKSSRECSVMAPIVKECGLTYHGDSRADRIREGGVKIDVSDTDNVFETDRCQWVPFESCGELYITSCPERGGVGLGEQQSAERCTCVSIEPTVAAFSYGMEDSNASRHAEILLDAADFYVSTELSNWSMVKDATAYPDPQNDVWDVFVEGVTPLSPPLSLAHETPSVASVFPSTLCCLSTALSEPCVASCGSNVDRECLSHGFTSLAEGLRQNGKSSQFVKRELPLQDADSAAQNDSCKGLQMCTSCSCSFSLSKRPCEDLFALGLRCTRRLCDDVYSDGLFESK